MNCPSCGHKLETLKSQQLTKYLPIDYLEYCARGHCWWVSHNDDGGITFERAEGYDAQLPESVADDGSIAVAQASGVSWTENPPALVLDGHDGHDYKLVESSAWIEVGSLTLWVRDTGRSAVVEVYSQHCEEGEPLSSLEVSF